MKNVYSFYSSTPTNLLNMVPEVVEVVSPAVDTAENGSRFGPSSLMYLLKDGRSSFSKSVIGVISYTGYDAVTGLPAMRIADADTTRTGSGQELQGIAIPASPVSFASTGSPLRIHLEDRTTRRVGWQRASFPAVG